MSEPAIESESHTESPKWAVWRIDDTGNTFIVQEHLTLVEAEKLVQKFTARGHKQMYWAEQEQRRS
ncbi:hypothetical protein [Zavarzinella formosa]|uniref:hypothetical protein n=1 Tax=Zavarzinella formosa TaxID=360055 RepID=UPI0007C4D3ED|nr:hypothetical protein [Zavarzinella formosa]